MGSRRRFRFIGISLLVFAFLATGAAGDNQCESINTQITSTFSTPCSSPIGICTAGNIAGGLLKGSTSFTALSLAAGPPPATAVYTVTLSIGTGQGTLHISDAGGVNTTKYALSELVQIQ